MSALVTTVTTVSSFLEGRPYPVRASRGCGLALARVPPVFPTTALPNNDLPGRHLPNDPGSRSNWGRSALAEADGPPTLRVPVAVPSVAAGPLVVTPPPLSDLKLPASEWSADGEDDIPTARRSPRVGDTLLGFKLVGELGRGAFARVFLADLAATRARKRFPTIERFVVDRTAADTSGQ